jgi:hypothetical protein
MICAQDERARPIFREDVATQQAPQLEQAAADGLRSLVKIG